METIRISDLTTPRLRYSWLRQIQYGILISLAFLYRKIVNWLKKLETGIKGTKRYVTTCVKCRHSIIITCFHSTQNLLQLMSFLSVSTLFSGCCIVYFYFIQLLKNKAGNDMYVERGMQTYNNAPKQKDVQTSFIGKEVC